jgi:hypothetical protein
VTRKTKGAKSGENGPGAGKPRNTTRTGAAPVEDIAMVVARDVEGVHILRRRSEESPVEMGLLKPMREGQPISGEVITLKQRQDVPFFYDVRSEFGGPPPPEPKEPGDGPAQVTTDAYRKGWDAVWGRRRDRSIN